MFIKPAWLTVVVVGDKSRPRTMPLASMTMKNEICGLPSGSASTCKNSQLLQAWGSALGALCVAGAPLQIEKSVEFSPLIRAVSISTVHRNPLHSFLSVVKGSRTHQSFLMCNHKVAFDRNFLVYSIHRSYSTDGNYFSASQATFIMKTTDFENIMVLRSSNTFWE